MLRADPDLSWEVTEVVRQVIADATIERVVAWIGDGGSGLCSRCWTLDPIDGTKGFLHGRQYVIALALVVDGSVQMSVIGCPRLSVIQADGAVTIGELAAQGGIAIAVRGHGAWWSPAARTPAIGLRYRRVVMSSSRASCSLSKGGMEIQNGSRVSCAPLEMQPPLLMDSQAKQVTVAAGAADLLMRFPPNAEFHDAVWDQAAGSLLIEEAGGRVTDLAGHPLDFMAGRRLLFATRHARLERPAPPSGARGGPTAR